jgi:Uma2 family endonuclease
MSTEANEGKHSTIQTELATAVNGALKGQKVARAFSELQCTYPSGSQPAAVYGNRSTIPDVSVVTWARIPRDPSGEIANTF